MKPAIAEANLPVGVLLERYRTDGGFVDCFVVDLPRQVSLSQLIEAFYTSRAFKPERWLLGMLLGKKADDQAALRLADGTADRFSAWSVEARREDEILLCDFQFRTRSWLMVRPGAGGTRLHFGTAVVPAQNRTDKVVFTALLGFHRWYSRILLRGAVAQL